jgi:hypothetical protein
MQRIIRLETIQLHKPAALDNPSSASKLYPGRCEQIIAQRLGSGFLINPVGSTKAGSSCQLTRGTP